MRLLLDRGADPNAREPGDNATPLHFAAGHGSLGAVRALLDAGADPQGVGDLHQMDVIGWATCFAEPRRDVVELLVARGARHHVFSAIALGDADLVRRVVAEEPAALSRRLSRFEQEQSALHYVIAPGDGLVGGTFRTGGHYRTLDVLLQLGADLEARDAMGRTPLEVAMLRGDADAMGRLHAAGARLPSMPPGEPSHGAPAPAGSIDRLAPMLGVPDMAATIAWYQDIGFTLAGSHGGNGAIDWACVSLGKVEIMLVPSGSPWRGPSRGLSLWLYTDRLDDVYAHLKRLQLQHARALLTPGATDGPEVRFTVDLHTAFYGLREFGVRDPNGVELMFAQPDE